MKFYFLKMASLYIYFKAFFPLAVLAAIISWLSNMVQNWCKVLRTSILSITNVRLRKTLHLSMKIRSIRAKNDVTSQNKIHSTVGNSGHLQQTFMT